MKKIFKIVLLVSLILFVSLLITGITILSYSIISASKIELNKENLYSSISNYEIYDNNNELVFDSNKDGVKITKISEISPKTIEAFTSIEDKEFYNHKGLNYKRIVKATFNNIKSFSFKEGASTISQQLIKNTHLSNEKTIIRKIKEMALTKKLENSFNKDEIMEMYLNIIYFGNGAYGITNASKNYFNKIPSELTISESALLAGLIKSPKTYSPIYNIDNCIKRRNLVLSEMLKDNKISNLEYETAINEDIDLNIKNNKTENLYYDFVIEEACNILGLSNLEIANSNYKLYTYQDKEKQKALDSVIFDDNYYLKNSYGNVADSLSMITDNNTFGVVAVSGKSDYDLVNFYRQPGSTIKPIICYAPALDKGIINLSTKILDEEIDIMGYKPKNVGNQFYGYVGLKECVSKSLNIPAIKTMQYVGIEKCKDYAKKCKIEFDKLDNGYAIALGGMTYGTTLKQLTNTFTPFVNNGKFSELNFIKKIETKNGVTLYNRSNNEIQAIGEDTATLMNELLKDGVKNGTSKQLFNEKYEIAGKTGTVAVPGTNYNTDAFSVAYTNDHIMSVWLGNYSNKKEYNLEGNNNGGTKATKIIKDTFDKIYVDNYPSNFEISDKVIKQSIDELSLIKYNKVKLANEKTPIKNTITEYFSERFKIEEITDIYDNYYIENININNNGNKNHISFDAVDYFDYEIYRNSKLINKVENYNGKYEFIDQNLSFNTKYNYFIKIIDKSGKYTQSETFFINMPINDYDLLIDNIENDTNYAWYFQ